MSVIEQLRLALSRLRTSQLRAALTMLGIIIGVASVVALVAVGQGTTANITTRLSSLGTNLLTVNPGAQRIGNTVGAAGSSGTLTIDDATAIAALADIAAVAPEVSTQAFVTNGDTNTTTSIIGTTSGYPQVRAYDLWVGTFLTDVSVEHHLRVAVLGASTADDLGIGAEELGTEITIAGLPFQVVGILQPKGGTGFQDPDDQVMVPISVIQRNYVPGDTVRTVGISVATPEGMTDAKAAITALLRERHGLSGATTDDFSILDQAQLLDAASSISDTLTLLLAGIASISLVVGGIGIMNIMLVAVRERTREIGIRKAIGARGRDILAQFLVEALTLSLLGGALGVLAGLAVSVGISRLAGWPFTFNPVTVAAAVGFSAAVGIVFGVWPARQAARLDPITALRYE